VIDILSRRIDSLGVIEPTIYQKGDTEIVIELPGFTDEQEARDLLQTTARLEFRYLKDVRTTKNPDRDATKSSSTSKATMKVVKFRDLNQPRRQDYRARHTRISENHRVLAAHRHG
jgi:preprotein translocase subunit SecD